MTCLETSNCLQSEDIAHLWLVWDSKAAWDSQAVATAEGLSCPMLSLALAESRTHLCTAHDITHCCCFLGYPLTAAVSWDIHASLIQWLQLQLCLLSHAPQGVAGSAGLSEAGCI